MLTRARQADLHEFRTLHRPFLEISFVRARAGFIAAPSRSMFLATAFANTDGKVVVVVMNPTAQQGQYNIVVAPPR